MAGQMKDINNPIKEFMSVIKRKELIMTNTYVIYTLRHAYVPDTQGLERPEPIRDERGNVKEFHSVVEAENLIDEMNASPYTLVSGESSRPDYAVVEWSIHAAIVDDGNIIGGWLGWEDWCDNAPDEPGDDDAPCGECAGCVAYIINAQREYIKANAIYIA